MAVIDQVLGHVVEHVARVAQNEPATSALPSGTSSPSLTPTGHPSDEKDDGGGSSSHLLFFVALGFGVVFTNLW
jgi:hypothetical protein